MECNTQSKILFLALDSPRLFSVCHLPTAQYISDCQGFVHDTEFLNVVILFLIVKEWSIFSEIALLIRHESCYCRIVNLFLDNLGQPQYGLSLGHDIENFVEGRNYPLVPLIYLQFWEILPNKRQMFHSKFMYIPWIWKYCKSKRIHRNAIINAHNCKCNYLLFFLESSITWIFLNVFLKILKY
jgi:hypothetical protein